MNRLDLIRRVRSLTRDFSNAIFRESDIVDYINEGIAHANILLLVHCYPNFLHRNQYPF